MDEAAARRRLGNILHTRESMRRVWIAEWWDALRQDAHYTWRSWRRHPGFALGAILVLALGLGASTALFAALDRVLFRPLPYADPDRLVSVGSVVISPDGSSVAAGVAESITDTFYVQEWETPPAPFQSVTTMVALVSGARTCEIAEGQQEGLRCELVEHNFLRVLGARIALGRDFAAEDDVRGAPPVALISHALWVRRFGADPEVVDRTVRLERGSSLLQARIVGVLPPDFEMPFETADILLPAQMRPLDPKSPFRMSTTVLARLRPDVTPDRARLMLQSQWPVMMKLPPGFREEWRVRPLHDRRVGDAPRVAWLLMGAVAVFLLIACVNVTNLMLARVGERRREFGVRAAIGAGRTRLARLALAESLLLALAAGGIGLLVAFALLETFVAMAPPGIPGVADAAIDLRVFAVAALLVVLTGTAIGVWPAVSVFRAGAIARTAFDGHVIAGRAAARSICAGHHADRADAGAARRLRTAAAKPVERRQRAARFRCRACDHDDRGAQPRPVSDGRARGRVLRRAARTCAGHAGCGISGAERFIAATPVVRDGASGVGGRRPSRRT